MLFRAPASRRFVFHRVTLASLLLASSTVACKSKTDPSGSGNSTKEQGPSADANDGANERPDAAGDEKNKSAEPSETPPPQDIADKAPDGLEIPEDMAYIAGGFFQLGCMRSEDERCQSDESPIHDVEIGPYFIDRFEVRARDYQRCVDAKACAEAIQPAENNDPNAKCNGKIEGREDHPINCVDWDSARKYCEWAGKRLPTEAEWERAARGMKRRKFPWGETPQPECDRANYFASESGDPNCVVQDTMPVGSKSAGATPEGVHDLAGNVWEWVFDHYQAKYYGIAPLKNPHGPGEGINRVYRGGSYSSKGDGLRAANRNMGQPDTRTANIGFRCAKSLLPPE